MACSYKTITLVGGEQFILPPGAEVIGVSDTTAISATNDCVDLTKLETLQCYAVGLASSNPGGSETPVYNDVIINGIRVDNAVYNFSAFAVGINGGTTTSALVDRLNQTPFGPLIFEFHRTIREDADRGAVIYMAFKTYPSVASNMYFIGSGTGVVSGPSTDSVPIEFRVGNYADRPQNTEFPWPPC